MTLRKDALVLKGFEKASIRPCRVFAVRGRARFCMLDVLRWSLTRFGFTWLCNGYLVSCIGFLFVACNGYVGAHKHLARLRQVLQRVWTCGNVGGSWLGLRTRLLKKGVCLQKPSSRAALFEARFCRQVTPIPKLQALDRKPSPLSIIFSQVSQSCPESWQTASDWIHGRCA